MDLNKVMIIGRLTRDPELRSTASGRPVASFGVATNRYWTDANGQKQESVEYHNVVLWSKLAEIASQYLKKGKRAFFEGRLQTRDWTGQDGVKRRTTEIIAESMIMLDGGGSGSYAPAPSQPSNGNQPQDEQLPTVDVMEEEVKVEDIPF